MNYQPPIKEVGRISWRGLWLLFCFGAVLGFVGFPFFYVKRPLPPPPVSVTDQARAKVDPLTAFTYHTQPTGPVRISNLPQRTTIEDSDLVLMTAPGSNYVITFKDFKAAFFRPLPLPCNLEEDPPGTNLFRSSAAATNYTR